MKMCQRYPRPVAFAFREIHASTKSNRVDETKTARKPDAFSIRRFNAILACKLPVSVRNDHFTRLDIAIARKGNGRENKPARDASHTREITRYFCHP